MAAGRQAIVDALGTVDGLAPSPGQPASVVTGSAWPVRSAVDWLNTCATQTTWYVFVALPNGADMATIEAGDELMGEVAAALWPVCRVVRAEPYQIPVEPGQQPVPVLRYTLED